MCVSILSFISNNISTISLLDTKLEQKNEHSTCTGERSNFRSDCILEALGSYLRTLGFRRSRMEASFGRRITGSREAGFWRRDSGGGFR